MNQFLLITVFLIFPVLNKSQNADASTSITQNNWFWPLIAISLALLFSIPCTLITVIVICHKKPHTDDFDESTIDSSSSSSSSSTTPVPGRARCHHCHHHRSHHVGGLRSPPPPYRTSNEPENVFITASLPPPYESDLIENDLIPVTTNPTTTTVVINVEPAESIITQSSTNPRLGTTLDVSSTLTNPSLQTFQV